MATLIERSALYLYRITSGYEWTRRTVYTREELLAYSNKVLAIASKQDNTQYKLKNYYTTPEKKLISSICILQNGKYILDELAYAGLDQSDAAGLARPVQYSILKAMQTVLEQEVQEELSEIYGEEQ